MRNQILALLDSVSKEHISGNSEYQFNDHKVPRVTQIISRCIHDDRLMSWANGLGFKHISYYQVLREAASIGTGTHNAIDKFLGNLDCPDIMQESRNAFNSYLKWYSDISLQYPVNILFKEHKVTCPYYGGTFDGLYNINGRNILVDYKTSNHVRFNYFLQLAAYIFMIENYMNIHVDGCTILRLSKLDVDYIEYGLNFSVPEDRMYIEQCIDGFLSMTLWYYQLESIAAAFTERRWDK